MTSTAICARVSSARPYAHEGLLVEELARAGTLVIRWWLILPGSIRTT